jgi:hypothetical protein
VRQARTDAARVLGAVPGFTGDRLRLSGIDLGEPIFAGQDEACRVARDAAREAKSVRDRLAGERPGWRRSLEQIRAEDVPKPSAPLGSGEARGGA